MLDCQWYLNHGIKFYARLVQNTEAWPKKFNNNRAV